MNDRIYLTSNKMIRNMIIFADFGVVALAVALVEMENDWVQRPYVLLLLSFCAMALAQSGYSTILHQYYTRVDKVLKRTTLLAFVFAVSLALFCWVGKWFMGVVAPTQAVLLIAGHVYALLLGSRAIEMVLLKLQRRNGRNVRRVAFVGMPNRIADVLQDLNYNATSGLRLAGYYSDTEDEELSKELPYLGNYEVMQHNIEAGRRCADEVYSTLPDSEKALTQKLLRHCLNNAIHFYYVPTFISEYGEYLRPSVIGEQVVFANFTEPLLDPMNRLKKRAFDVVCSGLALLVLLPFFPIIAIIIKCCSPGPVFFRQARTGMDGKDFMMLKFRSMHVNADADKVQATKDDPRKYPFGNFMRKTSIDELPQLWNIFVGDMSIVGPRPHMRKHTEEYRRLIDDYMLRHYIRPGLTGWAQTSGFRGETAELWQMEGRVKCDIWYIQNWSFWLDIRIIFRTAWQIVKKDKQAY